MFEQCNVFLNGKQVTSSSDNYHIRSYLDILINYGFDAANTHLQCGGWIIDTGKNINDQGSTNQGFVTRKERYKDSAIVDLEGKLHVDIFNQPKYLLNNVDVRIDLSLAKPDFFIMEKDSGKSTLKIMDATLYVKQVDINPSILLAHSEMLNHSNAIYPYKRVEIKTFTIPKGNQSFSRDNLLLGESADTIVFAMVDNAGKVGMRSKNPFSFEHNDITSFSLSVNGVENPMQGISTNFNQKIWTRAYRQLYSGIGVHHHDRGNQITRDMFAHGFFLLAFDLTPDSSGNDDHISTKQSGNVRIDVKFGSPLKETVTGIVYVEYNSTLEIDKDRNIYINSS